MSTINRQTKARVRRAHSRLPLRFEANVGQVDSQVKFYARGSGYNLFLTPTEAVLTLRNEKSKGDADLQSVMRPTGAVPALRNEKPKGDANPQIDSPEGALKADQLKAFSPRSARERRVLKYRNITIQLPASQLTELAKSDEIFAIEEYHEPVLDDEAQGQIVAGNLSGNAPTGPGYLAWLAGRGFDSSQFTSFAVNVVDTAYSLRGHPDLPDSRIAFENNPTNMSGEQNHHGFLNAHIIGGYNDGSGAAYEDANGFNYGLGIAPWARVGVTGLSGLGLVSPTEWEETAYGQSARISSNSWSLRSSPYDTLSQEYDRIVRDAQRGVAGNQQLTVVRAAGNRGPSSNTMNSPGSAKNVITVGASENVRPGIDGCGQGGASRTARTILPSFQASGRSIPTAATVASSLTSSRPALIFRPASRSRITAAAPATDTTRRARRSIVGRAARRRRRRPSRAARRWSISAFSTRG
jgi:hypothetical protein